jgi:excinuclease ABC subunit C
VSHSANNAEAKTFDGRAFAKSLASVPGVYRMYDANAALLYVGKAKNLRKRVETYFSRPAPDSRIQLMVGQIASIEVMVTRTEAEALLLENQLIKNLKPRYNIDLRDDKSYPYIYFSTQDTFPRLAFHRGARGKLGRYFGPFPSAYAVREVITTVQKLFQIRGCEDSYFAHRSRPCLQHQIKRCTAPCVGLIDQQQYAESVRHTELFLQGKSDDLVAHFVEQMEVASAALDFELAAKLRDQIGHLKRVQANHFVGLSRGDLDIIAAAQSGQTACVVLMQFRHGLNLGTRSYFPKLPVGQGTDEILTSFLIQHYMEFATPNEILLGVAPRSVEVVREALNAGKEQTTKLVIAPRGERARMVELAQRSAESALVSEVNTQSNIAARFEALAALLALPEIPTRLECFDISHTMGEGTVASCVVFDSNGPRKMDYRKFNITGITGGDDFAAMRVALSRRFRRVQDDHNRWPDILIIDGGKGQLRGALDVLRELDVSLQCVLGMAKGVERKSGFETLLVGEHMREIFPGPTSAASHLLQQIRDEAHRFAIAGHRARRQKARSQSVLEEIAGIGSVKRQRLLKAFGGLQGVSAAGVEELCAVPGVQRELAERIYASFRK